LYASVDFSQEQLRMPIVPASARLWLSTLLLGSMTAVANGAPDWPQFHGPRRDNLSTETGLLTSWPENGPKLLWTASGLGHGFATVAISDGRICTAGEYRFGTTASTSGPTR
jgi:hypothetical protein